MPAEEPHPLSQEPHVVRLSDGERASGLVIDEHVGEAISAVHRDGLVVLENAVDPAHCDELNAILRAEAEAMAKLPTTHFNDVSFFPLTRTCPLRGGVSPTHGLHALPPPNRS